MAFENDPNEIYAVVMIVHQGGRDAAEFLMGEVSDWYDEKQGEREDFRTLHCTVAHLYPINEAEVIVSQDRDAADWARTAGKG